MRALRRSQVRLPRVDRVRAGGPVEEEQPRAVVDLVLQRPGLERHGLERDLLAGARAARPGRRPGRPASRRRSGRARSCSPRAPSRCGWTPRPQRCTARTCRGAPASSGAPRRRRRTPARPPPPGARPVRRSPGLTRIVATRSAASRTVASEVGSTRSPGVDSTAAGARTTSRTRPSHPELGLRPRRDPSLPAVTAGRPRPRAASPRPPATRRPCRWPHAGRRRRCRRAGRSRPRAGTAHRPAGWSGR